MRLFIRGRIFGIKLSGWLSLGADFGKATALSLMLAIFLAVMSLLYFRVTRSWSTR